MYSPMRIIQTIKSITSKEIFRLQDEVKKKLWGGEFWPKGFYISTVGRHGDENTIQEYVKKQGSEKDYKSIYLGTQKWFTNLTEVGNITSTSIFAALDDLCQSERLKADDKILLLVPESGRFSYGTVLLTVEFPS